MLKKFQKSLIKIIIMLRLTKNKTVEQKLLEKLIITGSINFLENGGYEYYR